MNKLEITKPKKNNANLQVAAAGITGALIGAGVAVVAAVALRDEATREKTKKALFNLRDFAKEYMKSAANRRNVEQNKKVIYKKLKAKLDEKVK